MKYIYELQEFNHKVLNDHKSEILFAIAERLEHIVELSGVAMRTERLGEVGKRGWKAMTDAEEHRQEYDRLRVGPPSTGGEAMTNALLELRKATAEKIGWTQVTIEGEPGHEETYGFYPGCGDLDSPDAVGEVPPYECSLDACQELIEWARERGWKFQLFDTYNGNYRMLFFRKDESRWGESDNLDRPAEAICRAALKLEG